MLLPKSCLIENFTKRMSSSKSAVPSLAKNFPTSTASPSQTFRWPGITPQSTATVRRILEENNRTSDIYEKLRCKLKLVNLKGF